MTRLLVVDDNPQSLYMLQVLLSTNGFELELASNGAEALERARRAPPDMIISDILMPVMDGFALCRACKQDEQLRDIPFIFYTATYTDPKDEEFALSLGAARFIVKPLEPDKFLAMLRESIETHVANQQPAPREPIAEEAEYYKQYNAALIRKLENKVLELEETNRALALDIAERKRAEEKVRATLEEKETLLREVHHRVKNNLQAMIALMEMQSSHIQDPEIRLFLRELEGQARTMALVYEQLYQSESLARVDMGSYLRQLTSNVLETFGGNRDLQLDLDAQVTLDVAQAMPCGLIVNELLTNILKYAFPQDFRGRPAVGISLRQQEAICRLTVSDNGVGLPAEIDWSSGRTLGLRLVRLWATHQLGGTLDVAGQPGARFTVVFGL